MCMPCGARTRLKRYIRTPNTRRPGSLKTTGQYEPSR
jgi:hypothetical protein